MTSLLWIIRFIFIIQITNVVRECSAGYDNYIAFYCGRPTLIFQNDKWIHDYGQDCIKNENDIVTFCQKTFPDKNISSAEPAVEKIKFTQWCNFNNIDCEVNIEIRPFKCLTKDFQSDALTLPKDCLFAHLGGKRDDCKGYKDWIIAARDQCAIKPNWKLHSYGMLFQCGNIKGNIKPMFFKGVEFVCCPKYVKTAVAKEEVNEQLIYKQYLSNGVLETEEGEDKGYDDAMKKLKESDSNLKKEAVQDFVSGEEDLKTLWKSDPELAKDKENRLISMFKITYNAAEDQFKANQEQLLDFHDSRRKFLFATKLHAAMQRFETMIKNRDSKEMEITEVMEQILDLLMIRKKEIIEEQNSDRYLGSRLLSGLKMELQIIEHNVTDLFNRLIEVPQYKDAIKQHLVMYLMKKYPNISFSKTTKIEKPNDGKSELDEIIAKYRHKPDSEDEDSGKSFVHYDLGLDDKDQLGHHGNTDRKFIFDRDTLEKQFGDKKLLFGLVFGTLVTAFVILLVGSLLILYRHRPALFHYSLTQSKDQQVAHKKPMHGFGMETSSVGKDAINGSPFNGYENPTYKITHTSLDSSPAKVHDNQNSSSTPLIQS